MGLAARAPLMAGRMAFCASAILAGDTLQASPMAASQAAVPSWPTGAEPTTERPAVSNSRMDAV